MKTLIFIFISLATILFIYLVINIFVLLGSVYNFHPRDIVEKKAYDWLRTNSQSKFYVIEKWATEENRTSLEIANVLGGRNVILGCVYLLAANHMKKTSPP